jgi:FSR family fosmidomycin resistance protein-like MFS transporter
MKLLRHRTFLSVALSHLAVDTLSSQVGILLTLLAGSLALNNAAIGLFAALYSIAGAVGQPVFGWLADRYGPRWSIAGGVLWMAMLFSLFAVAPGYWPIVCLIVAALGSAAFHAPGAAKAAQIGHLHMAGQVATAASLFFLFGQGGFALGPAAGGFLVDRFSRSGVLFFTLPAILIGLLAARSLSPAREPVEPEARPESASRVMGRPMVDWYHFGLILLISALGRWTELAAATFLPKLLHDRGLSPSVYGLVLAVFMGASALGGVAGGLLGDRWGKLRTVSLASCLSAVPFFLMPIGAGPGLFAIAAAAGLLNGAPFSILVTMAQRALPGRGGLASGLTLGSMFAAGALGASITGAAADRVGLVAALQMNALLVLTALAVTLLAAYRSRPPVLLASSTAE